MKILITGAKGQLGTELHHVLKSKECEIGAINEIYKDCECLALSSKDLDISDFDKAREIITLNQPDVLINCAAFTDVDACETNKVKAMSVNALGPKNLAIICNNLDIKFVHISTDYVFSGDSFEPYCEWDFCNPKTVYGKSKLLGENYVTKFSDKYFILRTSWLYSPYGKNFAKTIFNLAKEKEKINIVNDQFGNPTSTNDLVYQILELAITRNYGIYHCSGEGTCSWYDFAKKIVEHGNFSCKVIPVTTESFQKINFRAAPRPKNSALDNLMLKTIALNKMRPWEKALKSVVNILCQN